MNEHGHHHPHIIYTSWRHFFVRFFLPPTPTHSESFMNLKIFAAAAARFGLFTLYGNNDFSLSQVSGPPRSKEI